MADCKASPKCFLCTSGAVGHVAGSGNCRVFREAPAKCGRSSLRFCRGIRIRIEWGERQPDSRGGRVLDMASRLGLVVLNTSSTSTFRRAGYRETIPDVSLATESLVAHVRDWQVIEDFTASDHQ